MRQQFADAACRSSRLASQEVLQVRHRLMAIELGGLNQTHDSGGAFAGAQAAGKYPVLAADHDSPDLILAPGIVDRHLAIGQVMEVMGQRHPASHALLLAVQIKELASGARHEASFC